MMMNVLVQLKNNQFYAIIHCAINKCGLELDYWEFNALK